MAKKNTSHSFSLIAALCKGGESQARELIFHQWFHTANPVWVEDELDPFCTFGVIYHVYSVFFLSMMVSLGVHLPIELTYF